MTRDVDPRPEDEQPQADQPDEDDVIASSDDDQDPMISIIVDRPWAAPTTAPWTGSERTLTEQPAAWSGAEPTMAEQPDVAESSTAPWTGSEPTMAEQPIMPWAGAEQTQAEQASAQPSEETAGTWTGEERTLAETPVPATEIAGTWTGEERTLAETPVPSSAAVTMHTWVGAERTLADTDQPTAPAPWSGAEGTLVDQPTPAPETSDGKPWRGAERTTAADEDLAAARAAKAQAVRAAREAAETRAASDGSWHTDGRTGPCSGALWGDYEVGAILGEGGMGVVYKGRQISLNRRVAIKVLPPAMANDPTLRERFEMESRTASLLQSPHVVQVYAAGQEGEHLYFVMEYVEGRELSDIIREATQSGIPIEPYQAGDYIVQAARGLQEAQRHGIVHRDIKPANLMVTADGLIKIADFGIVKIVGEHTLTMTGTAVGTPSYVSPEQGQGESTDARADIYSLGVVFYELLAGERPFKAATPNALIYQHCYTEPKLPSEIRPGIPEDYEAVVIKCLQKKPDNRYPDAGALVQDLDRIQIGHSPMVAVFASGKIGTGADEAMRANMNWLQRHFWLVAASLLAVLFLGGGGFYWQYSRDARAQELREKLGHLDQAVPPEKSAETDLAALKGLVGTTDNTQRWAEKLTRLRALEDRLQGVIDTPELAHADHQAAQRTLRTYEADVGFEAALAGQARARLANAERAIRERATRLREALGEGLISQVRRPAIEETLARYRPLVAADNELVHTVNERLQATDNRITALERTLTDLVERPGFLSLSDQERLRVALRELTPLIGADDARLPAWQEHLEASAGNIKRLRVLIGQQLNKVAWVSPALEEAVAKDFAAYEQLVDETDADWLRWNKKITDSRAQIATWRNKITAYTTDQAIVREEALPGVTQAVDELARLVGDDEEQVLAVRRSLKASRARIAEARKALLRLEDQAHLTSAEQARCAAALDTLDAHDAIDLASTAQYQQRLDEEAAYLAALRRTCIAFENPVTVSEEMRQALAALTPLVPYDDEAIQRWRSKDSAVRVLENALADLDRSVEPPAEAARQIDELAQLIGIEDPRLRRWREKLRRIEALRPACAVIDQVAPLPAEAGRAVRELADLIGERAADVARWLAKVRRVEELTATLADLDECYILPEGVEEASAELLSLVSQDDPFARVVARRVRVLRGPDTPSWAFDDGRDGFGRYVDLRLDTLLLRLRLIPAGAAWMGAEDEEAMRDPDERRVRIRLSRSFWLADSECTQALYRQVMGSDPSHFQGDERPVERVSQAQAVAFCVRLGDRIDALVRLPSEAEWEYACRAGHAGAYIGRAGVLPAERLIELGAFAGNAGDQTVIGRQFLPNPLGLYDLHGNVWEWCQDRYSPYPAEPAPDHVSRQGARAVARGGCWADPADKLRAANRVALSPEIETMFVGFRFVIETGETGIDNAPREATALPTAATTLDGQARLLTRSPR